MEIFQINKNQIVLKLEIFQKIVYLLRNYPKSVNRNGYK